ncbi:hypothetical protein I316_03026 [Kwoniella heveanensis BCC8398]|uniref:Uncharacterized protein n=1 Tax=Kwoniella heveanensis BCC8398 TaxID=1296120 RepID=A0A1B9GWR5_9TREE|nr:hypothetical protein I316_03026 [Kwoniella heveanensis BCC8398]
MRSQPDSRPLSPQILTPVNEPQIDGLPPAPTILMSSDGEDRVSDLGAERITGRPVSLLTAMIQTSDSHKPGTSSRANSHAASDQASALSSVPSTAFSSPRNLSHGILQQGGRASDQVGSSSILRRESAGGSSEGALYEPAVGLGLGGVEKLHHRLQNVEERRERIEWADDVAGKLSTPHRPGGLKFAVASQPSHAIGRSTAVRALKADDEMDEEDSDEGYQEDEEGGFDTDSSGELSDDDVDSRYPFARSTNFEEPRFIGSTQISANKPLSPAPALLPPPSRRGRGHIRVDESAAPPGEQNNTCSRHRSPPPTRSRSGSQARSSTPGSPMKRHHSGRLSDAGPREGRAGSPMPGRIQVDPDDDDDQAAQEGEEENGDGYDNEGVGEEDGADPDQEEVDHAAGGWRSDDAIFHGPKARQVKPIIIHRQRRHSSALAQAHAVFVNSDEEGESSTPAIGTSVRGLLRRASAHLANFRRPSSGGMHRIGSEDGSHSGGGGGLSGRLSTQTTCPPALDETPAMAQGLFTHEYGDGQGGLAHRLETTLLSPSNPSSANVSRSVSMKRAEQVEEELR